MLVFARFSFASLREASALNTLYWAAVSWLLAISNSADAFSKSEDDIVPLAYDEHEDTDILGNYTRFSKCKAEVLEAIVNLYLKKQIVFE